MQSFLMISQCQTKNKHIYKSGSLIMFQALAVFVFVLFVTVFLYSASPFKQFLIFFLIFIFPSYDYVHFKTSYIHNCSKKQCLFKIKPSFLLSVFSACNKEVLSCMSYTSLWQRLQTNLKDTHSECVPLR